jgi:hypothetical protein
MARTRRIRLRGNAGCWAYFGWHAERDDLRREVSAGSHAAVRDRSGSAEVVGGVGPAVVPPVAAKDDVGERGLGFHVAAGTAGHLLAIRYGRRAQGWQRSSVRVCSKAAP